jgi:hypothetical protein
VALSTRSSWSLVEGFDVANPAARLSSDWPADGFVCRSCCRPPTSTRTDQPAAPAATGSHRHRREQANQDRAAERIPSELDGVHDPRTVTSSPCMDGRNGRRRKRAIPNGPRDPVVGRSHRKSVASRRDNRIVRTDRPFPRRSGRLALWHGVTVHANMGSFSLRRRPPIQPGRLRRSYRHSQRTRRHHPGCCTPAGSHRAKRTAAVARRLPHRRGGTDRPARCHPGLGSYHTGRQHDSCWQVVADRSTVTSRSRCGQVSTSFEHDPLPPFHPPPEANQPLMAGRPPGSA